MCSQGAGAVPTFELHIPYTRQTPVPTKNALAKINLGLHVLRKRDDGLHDIETVFVRIRWADTLHVERADALMMTCSDRALPIDDRNLVMRAARILQKEYEPAAGAHMHLEKRIPYGAGLGGGSSDAAAALILLNELWSLNLDREKLARHALDIGSDVPFFLGPEAALGTGRGERLEPLIDPQTDEPFRPAYPLVVAVPEETVATAAAYAMITPRDGERADLREIVLSHDLERWRRELVNDFEAPILEAYPAIAEIKAALVAAGAGYASMTGSGSAVYGFFTESDTAAAASEALRQSGHRTWTGVV